MDPSRLFWGASWGVILSICSVHVFSCLRIIGIPTWWVWGNMDLRYKLKVLIFVGETYMDSHPWRLLQQISHHKHFIPCWHSYTDLSKRNTGFWTCVSCVSCSWLGALGVVSQIETAPRSFGARNFMKSPSTYGGGGISIWSYDMAETKKHRVGSHMNHGLSCALIFVYTFVWLSWCTGVGHWTFS